VCSSPESPHRPNLQALSNGYRPNYAQGTYCEYVSLPEADLARIPEGAVLVLSWR